MERYEVKIDGHKTRQASINAAHTAAKMAAEQGKTAVVTDTKGRLESTYTLETTSRVRAIHRRIGA